MFRSRLSSSLLGLACLAVVSPATLAQKRDAGHAGRLLDPAAYHHYVETFESQELTATGRIYNGEPFEPGQPPEAAWPWMQREIPWFDCADKGFEEMYYFRWYAWKKHLVKAPSGWLITEWLPKLDFPKPAAEDGSFGALPDAAPFHLGEARWLRDPAIAQDDARYWFRPGVDSHKYSDAMAYAAHQVALAQGDPALDTELLPAMVTSYRLWESTQQDKNGLFWSIDTRDAMEKSISGDGYRPTLNSYMVADAETIAEIAASNSQRDIAAEFHSKADMLSALVEAKLWNPKDRFYEVLSPAPDSGIRAQKRFIDPGTTLQLAGVRELIGYIPWMYGIPAPAHAVAWKQLFDPAGFDGPLGATTAERRSPRFRFASSDQCTWNGPAWPFAMTQTLNALATYENTPGPHTIGPEGLYRLFGRYVKAQHLKLPSGQVIDWIDEDYDADTGEWIAKNMLLAKNKQVGRGNYYNHSGFADPLITGLIGLRPQGDDRIVLQPLVPADAWSYFAIDALPYHGHLLTVAWDSTGERYHHGKGLTLAVDGQTVAHRATLGPLQARLGKATDIGEASARQKKGQQ